MKKILLLFVLFSLGNIVRGNPIGVEKARQIALEYIKNKYGFKIKEVGIDSGYDTLDIKKYLHDNEIFGVIAYRIYAKSETTV